jgi:hypothetical protein
MNPLTLRYGYQVTMQPLQPSSTKRPIGIISLDIVTYFSTLNTTTSLSRSQPNFEVQTAALAKLNGIIRKHVYLDSLNHVLFSSRTAAITRQGALDTGKH